MYRSRMYSSAQKYWKVIKTKQTNLGNFFLNGKYQNKHSIYREKPICEHNLTKQYLQSNTQNLGVKTCKQGWDIIEQSPSVDMARKVSKSLHKPSRNNLKKSILNDSQQMRLIINMFIDNGTRNYSTSIEKENVEKCGTINSEIVESIPRILTEKEIKELRQLFPSPKNTLHNVYDLVSRELKNQSYMLRPLYVTKHLTKTIMKWECMYHLKWPTDIKFFDVAFTKQEASAKCALLVLNYLKSNGKLTKQNQPVLHGEEAKQKATILNLHPQALESMEEIVNCYENKFMPLLVNKLQVVENKEINEFVKEDWPVFKEKKRRFKGENYYLAKNLVPLPISKYKDDIMDVVKQNQIVVVKGEPGCGKSTRVPQYILESWAKSDREHGKDCRIIVTQPRRIAAISLAERVANEREENVGNTVGYQVRLKSNFNNYTGHVLYCTTGILLRRLQSDPKLSDCTHIIIDEAHERDVNTDLLINLMRRATQLNPDLKLVIMSATIDAEKFQKYFDTPCLIHIPGFTYPVDVNYLDENNNLSKTMAMCNSNNPTVVHEDVAKLIKYIHREKDEGAILCFLPGWDDIVKVRKQFEPPSSDMCVYCLHSRMQDSDQRRIFSKPPPGIRKVILATNIAETSVTIDDVAYVIDTGIQKEKRFDVEKGIVCIDNIWISKSSMAQRKGRAGRVKSGESFHLYPKTMYDSFIEYTTPEILRTSLTKIVLDSKVYSNNMKATEFLSQLLSPPETSAVLKAVDELKELELLDTQENLTPLGRVISEFQLEPSLAKAMVNSVVFKCVTPIVDIVTLFSAETELFSTGLTDKETINKCKKEFSKSSDHLSLMRIFEKWLEFEENADNRMANIFCRENNLVDYKLFTIRQLRSIHFDYLRKGLLDALPMSDKLSDNDELVKAVLLSGIGHILQYRNYDIVKGRLKKTNVLLTRNNHKATISSESVNYKRFSYPTNYLLYINETRSNIRRTTIVRETSLISPLALLLFKNNNIIIEEVPTKYVDGKINRNDHVLLKLENSKIECVCDKKQAEVIKKCKESLSLGMQYYIFQMTKGGEYNSDINQKWDDILQHLNNILHLQGIDNR